MVRTPPPRNRTRGVPDVHDHDHHSVRPLPAHLPGHCRLRDGYELAAIRLERIPPMTTITITTRYIRYLLTSVATVAFGLSMN